MVMKGDSHFALRLDCFFGELPSCELSPAAVPAMFSLVSRCDDCSRRPAIGDLLASAEKHDPRDDRASQQPLRGTAASCSTSWASDLRRPARPGSTRTFAGTRSCPHAFTRGASIQSARGPLKFPGAQEGIDLIRNLGCVHDEGVCVRQHQVVRHAL